MPDFVFSNIDSLKRNRQIEGETGTPTALGDSGIVLTLLAATDANSRWKAFGPQFTKELQRLNRAKAGEEKIKVFLAEWYTRLFVKDWDEGAPKDEHGADVPFGEEACRSLLLQSDDAIPTIMQVVYESQNFRGGRVQAIVDTAKN